MEALNETLQVGNIEVYISVQERFLEFERGGQIVDLGVAPIKVGYWVYSTFSHKGRKEPLGTSPLLNAQTNKLLHFDNPKEALEFAKGMIIGSGH